MSSTQVHYSNINASIYIEEADYDNNNLPAQYNKIRWEKKLISNLQMMMVSIWNERWKIVTISNIETNEI